MVTPVKKISQAPTVRLEWSSLAQKVFGELPAPQRRAVRIAVEKLKAFKPSKPGDVVALQGGSDKFVVPLVRDQLRLVAHKQAGGWRVVDIAQPAGGFTFKPLLPSTGNHRSLSIKAATKKAAKKATPKA